MVSLELLLDLRNGQRSFDIELIEVFLDGPAGGEGRRGGSELAVGAAQLLPRT